jgi:hypothetical protein
MKSWLYFMVIWTLALYRAYNLKYMCTKQVCSQGGRSGCNAPMRNLKNSKTNTMIKSKLCEKKYQETDPFKKKTHTHTHTQTGIGLECEQQATDTVVQWESLVLARSPARQITGPQGALSCLVAGCHTSKEGGREGGGRWGQVWSVSATLPCCASSEWEREKDSRQTALNKALASCTYCANLSSNYECHQWLWSYCKTQVTRKRWKWKPSRQHMKWNG